MATSLPETFDRGEPPPAPISQCRSHNLICASFSVHKLIRKNWAEATQVFSNRWGPVIVTRAADRILVEDMLWGFAPWKGRKWLTNFRPLLASNMPSGQTGRFLPSLGRAYLPGLVTRRQVGVIMEAALNLIESGIYGVSEAAALVGATERKVRGWVTGYKTAGIGPLIDNEIGWLDGRLAFSFTNLMEIRFVAFFVKAGVQLRYIRAIMQEVKRELDHPHPFATRTVFRTDGKKIVAEIARRNGVTDIYDLRVQELRNAASRIGVVEGRRGVRSDRRDSLVASSAKSSAACHCASKVRVWPACVAHEPNSDEYVAKGRCCGGKRRSSCRFLRPSGQPSAGSGCV